MPRNIELFIDAQNILSSEEAAVYDTSFNERNWWGDPDNMPIIGAMTPVQASKIGRKLLELYPAFNGGMLRLGDPVEPENPLQADDHPKGTIVKTTFENFVYSHGLQSLTDGHLTTTRESDKGYIIMKYYEGNYAAYRQYVNWWASAEAQTGGLGFFPLHVNYAASYNARLTDKYSPALKILGSLPKHGQKEITLRKSQVDRDKTSCSYIRVGAVAIYQPLETPRAKSWIPKDLGLH